MALLLKNWYLQSDNKEDVSVYDGTGIGTSSNTGGYGYLGNPVVGDFTTCVVDIYPPDATTLLPSATILATIDMYPTLPNISGAPFVLTSAMVFGATQSWTDGFYKFVVRQSIPTDPATVYTSTSIVPIFAQTLCCIENLILTTPICDCHGSDFLNLLKADMFLDQLKAKEPREEGGLSPIEECSLFNKGAEILIDAAAICAAENCHTCKTC